MVMLAQATANSGSALGGAIGTVLWLAITIVLIVAAWRLFEKAGRPGWASLIPIYNTIVMLQITGQSGWWILGLFVPFLNFFVIIRLIFNLATVFGRSVAFGFGLLFLAPIFLCILAFGDARYVGFDGGGARQFGSSVPASGAL